MDPISQQLMMGAAGSGDAKTYIEDVFSTWLYTGNGSTQTITNGIDLSGKGGLVWVKSRSAAYANNLHDTVRGANSRLISDLTNSASTVTTGVTSFSSTGFDLGSGAVYNDNGATFTSWTFRKAAKFFDVVTYTGNGSTQTINHNLGSVPGCIIIKGTNSTFNWRVYHRSLANNQALNLNTTDAVISSVADWNSTTPTATSFSLGNTSYLNANGSTYVAYLFAHDTGTDGLIQCGSYTGNGSTTGPTVSLGWEPQWLLVKRVSGGTGDWGLVDTMRDFGVSTNAELNANNSGAESTGVNYVGVRSTGFQLTSVDTEYNGNGSTYIYIAIRRGPMRTPTDATKVFTALAATGSTNTSRTVGFPADLSFTRWRSGVTAMQAVDRLRGMPTSSNANALLTSSTAAEAGTSPYAYDIWNTTAKDGSNANLNDMVWQYFRRAPGFFDVVAYNGNSNTAQNVSHNLGVQPELMIFKTRSGGVNDWFVYHKDLGVTKFVNLNYSLAATTSTNWLNNTAPTASVFSLGTFEANWTTYPHIAYLFATCPGVSKVGSYTGSGTTKQIDCGFTAGARFVLIKRTDSTGDWYVWDTARGIVSGNDPYLLLNSTAAEVTNTDYIDPLNSGFEISSTAPAAINANGGSFIFLAVA